MNSDLRLSIKSNKKLVDQKNFKLYYWWDVNYRGIGFWPFSSYSDLLPLGILQLCVTPRNNNGAWE